MASKNILDDSEAMACIRALVDGGYGVKQVRDAISVLEVLALPEPERAWKMVGVAKPLAYGENGIYWTHCYGAVWCHRSTTQFDYCGSLASWKMPEHAKPAKGGVIGGAQ